MSYMQYAPSPDGYMKPGLKQVPRIIPITMICGNTFCLKLKLKNIEPTAIYFTVRGQFGRKGFSKSLEDGISSIGDGVYLVRIAPEDTAQLTPAIYFYDCDICVGDDMYTPFGGSFRLLKDIATAGCDDD